MNNSNQIKSKNEQIQSVKEIYETMDFSQSSPIYPNKTLWIHTLDDEYNFLHSHNFFEIGICKKGRGTFHINGKIYSFTAPCISIIYPQIMHSAQSLKGEKTEWSFLYISLENLFSGRIKNAEQLINSLDINNYFYPHIFSQNDNLFLYQTIEQIIIEASEGKKNYLEIIALLTSTLILFHKRMAIKNDNVNIKNDEYSKLIPAINFINANYSQTITIKKLASLCFISEASLNRLFNTIFKMSPYEYIQDIRLENAVLMLKTNKSILEIANDVGYNSISCFNKTFKKKYNMSPREYKTKSN